MRNEQMAMRMRSSLAGGLGGARGYGDVAMLSRANTQARSAGAALQPPRGLLERQQGAAGLLRGNACRQIRGVMCTMLHSCLVLGACFWSWQLLSCLMECWLLCGIKGIIRGMLERPNVLHQGGAPS